MKNNFALLLFNMVPKVPHFGSMRSFSPAFLMSDHAISLLNVGLKNLFHLIYFFYALTLTIGFPQVHILTYLAIKEGTWSILGLVL